MQRVKDLASPCASQLRSTSVGLGIEQHVGASELSSTLGDLDLDSNLTAGLGHEQIVEALGSWGA